MNSYRKLCTEFYDLDKPAPPPEALALYRTYARQASGCILEAMCGSGRFLLPLLAEGYAVEGVDTSPNMIRANSCSRSSICPTGTGWSSSRPAPFVC